MKIAILVGGLPPVYNGGTEIATLKIAEYAARAGHDVHVIAADGTRRGATEYLKQERGFKIHRIATIPKPYLHGLSFIPCAVNTIRRLRPDWVHAQGEYVAPGALLAWWLFGIPYILYDRGGMYLNTAFQTPTMKALTMHAGRIVAQTEHMARSFARYTDRTVEIIPNGVDADRFGGMSQREARTRLGFPIDAEVVLSVGQCRPEKNMMDFVRAALHDYGSDRERAREYVMVGGGHELSRLRDFASSAGAIARHLHIEGEVPNHAIPVYMAAADVLVNTSLTEGFPVTILEGMAAGLPIIAPDTCGIAEIVRNGENGILTKVGKWESTLAAIDLVLSNPVQATQMAETNRQEARNYTWETVVKMLYG